MAAPRVLIADDEKSMRELLEFTLKKEGHEVTLAESGEAALDAIRRERYDLVITDVRMPNVDGVEVLRAAKDVAPDTAVIMITAYSTIEAAVEAMKLGAYDYIAKPFRLDEFTLVVRNALERKRLQDENIRLQDLVANFENRFEGIIAKSVRMRDVFEIVQKVAGSASTVMITGESGTGKELIATAIHYHMGNPRRQKPFISVNCGAIPEGLMESELFGHVKGSFTGAVAHKRGLFEEADGGTLFLDEVTEIPPFLQVKLLRAIQEKTIRRVGDTKDMKVDVRLIAASNKDLEATVADGTLREDLFYRLNVIPIRLPPLRDRREDIPLLVSHFIRKFSTELGRAITGVSPEAMQLLEQYHWPGNIRELENVIERAMVLGGGELLTSEALPDTLRRERLAPGLSLTLPEKGMDLEATLDGIERQLLEQALERTKGVQTRAAELLRMSFRQFRYKLQKHQLRRGRDEEADSSDASFDP
ncbi:MAG: sigma-54-dependent transcriptional regulator [Candidatus Methylomirabilia bacterium]